VLTGLIAGLLAQGLDALDATLVAVYLHGLAGDLAAGRLGEAGLAAGDLIAILPAALAALKGEDEEEEDDHHHAPARGHGRRPWRR
jgi:NAD(P)H-hydrate epimerase